MPGPRDSLQRYQSSARGGISLRASLLNDRPVAPNSEKQDLGLEPVGTIHATATPAQDRSTRDPPAEGKASEESSPNPSRGSITSLEGDRDPLQQCYAPHGNHLEIATHPPAPRPPPQRLDLQGLPIHPGAFPSKLRLRQPQRVSPSSRSSQGPSPMTTTLAGARPNQCISHSTNQPHSGPAESSKKPSATPNYQQAPLQKFGNIPENLRNSFLVRM